MIYAGTHEDKQRREVRLLQERLVRFEVHPLYGTDRGTFVQLAAEAVREKLREIGQSMRRTHR